MRIEVKAGQDLLDVAVQYTGYAYNAYPIADANELAITDDLAGGEFIKIPDDLITDIKVTNHFVQNGLQPASAITKDQESVIRYGGIGFMKLESTFIVS